MTTKKQVLFFVLVLFSLRAIARGEDTSIKGRDVAKAYAEGKSAVDKGDFALAISSFSEAVRLDPKFSRPRTTVEVSRTGGRASTTRRSRTIARRFA